MMKRSLFMVGSLVVLAACQDAGPPPTPVALQPVASLTLPASVVGAALGTAPTFQVLAENGKPIKGVPVTITVTSGGGTLASAPVKTRSGETSIGVWTLGPTAGPQTVRVSVEALPSITFTVNATPAAASALQKLTGDNARAPALTELPATLTVKVADAFGNGIPNATVGWQVTAGGGSLAATSSTTDSVGVATAPVWTLGAQSSGTQTLRATSGSRTQDFTASIQAPPASITIVSAPPTAVAAGTSPQTAPTFAVRDADGNILNSIPVTVSVTAGGGAITNAPVRTLVGPTPIGNWTLGTPLGTQTVQVAVAGIPSLFISTTAVVGPPAVFDVVEGGGQRALAGTSIANPIRLRVRDVALHPVANTTVTWEVIAGGGELASFSSTSNASGIATMPTWTLGKAGGVQTVRATAAGVSSNVTAQIQSDFGLQLRWASTPPGGDVEQAFTRAVDRINAIIVGQVAPVVLSNFVVATSCVASGPTLNETLNGLLIYATVEPIDGPGAVLGSAGPCYTRTSDSLSLIGRMRFDIADLDNMVINGTLEAVVLHEMLHVIGVGTLWALKGKRFGLAPTTTPFFTGALAKAACINEAQGAAVCGGGVPIEDCVGIPGCGQGTINSHWKELTFRTELMTGYVSSAALGNPFSKMTIQSLADLGYVVNLNGQDPYVVPPPSLMSSIPAFSVRMPEPHGPLAEVDQNGRITRRFMTKLPEPDR